MTKHGTAVIMAAVKYYEEAKQASDRREGYWKQVTEAHHALWEAVEAYLIEKGK